MKIYAIANQKGGVAKSTTSVNLASLLRERGYKTLLIDMDSQRNSTDAYGLLDADINGKCSISDVLYDKTPIEEAIFHTDYGDIVPSDQILKEADIRLSSNPDGSFVLSDALSSLKGYDYVFIDTPPGIGYSLYNSLIAANEVIITMAPARSSSKGLAELLNTIKNIQNRQNSNLRIAGILMTRFDRRTPDSKEAYEDIKEVSEKTGVKLFDTVIHSRQVHIKAEKYRMPLCYFAKKNAINAKRAKLGLEDYNNFVDELLSVGGR